MASKIYTPSGIKITVLSVHDEGEYYMVRSDTSGKVFFAHKDQVTDPLEEDKESEQSDTQRLSRRGRRKVSGTKPEKKVVVKPQVPTDNRVNLNTLTAEGLTQVLPGVGIKTAKEIVELCLLL